MNYVNRILYCSSLFFCLFSFFKTKAEPHNSPYLSSERVEHWILIHGTFARAMPWYKKGGSGYEALSQALTRSKQRKFIVHSFLWSSFNNHEARTRAAQELRELLQQLSTNKYHTIHIVAHSHGGTVGLLTANMLTEQNSHLRITEFFALGMPVHADWYPKAWDSIDTMYHLFSYGDFIQPVFTMFERMLPKAPNIYNLPVKKNNEGLWHETLRSADILIQLPSLHKLLTEKGSYCLHLDTKSKETSFFTVTPYSEEEKEKDKAIDQAYIKQILNLYAETRKRSIASLGSSQEEPV
jgi:hypothetical protein